MSQLTEKLEKAFRFLGGQKVLTESNVSSAMEEVRLALLEADANYGVVASLIERVKAKALGLKTLQGVSPKEQFIKLIHDELVSLMGEEEASLDLKGKLSTILLVGLQGSGKTTSAAKLALYLKKKEPHKKILLAGCDLSRPAAILQLETLAQSIEVPFFSDSRESSPLVLAKKAFEKAEKEGFDILIVDTAGRLHTDAALMREIREIKEALSPRETLFVASAMTGQDAVKTAETFHTEVAITGSILTMLDGNARAGAALSIREITKRPLKFEGVGEKLSDFQLFHPHSMADRILGMGDVINLVKKAEEHFDERSAKELEEKMRKSTFDFEDYLKQMSRIKKMGSFQGLLSMLPGMGALGGLDMSDQEFRKMEAMIFSMTPKERREKEELTHLRRKRIAKGSGLALDEVNRLIKGFKRVKQMFKNIPDMKNQMKGFNFSGLEELKNQLMRKS